MDNKFKFKDKGDRLKQFALEKYGSVAELERRLNKKRYALNQYINGRNKPGSKLLKELEELGCDPVWLMSGHFMYGLSNKKKYPIKEWVEHLAKEEDVQYYKVIDRGDLEKIVLEQLDQIAHLKEKIINLEKTNAELMEQLKYMRESINKN